MNAMHRPRHSLVPQLPNVPIAPFACATVFLCHSCADHEIADRIFSALKQEFYAFYDHRSPSDHGDYVSLLGEPVFKPDLIDGVDFFLFLASKDSLRKTSWAYREFVHAMENRPGHEGRLGIIALHDFELPRKYQFNLAARCARSTMDEDAIRITRDIRSRLAQLAGCQESQSGLIPGVDPSRVIESLLEGREPRAYPLAIVYPRTETELLIEELGQLPESTLNELATRLVHMYIRPPRNSDTIVRTNCAYILSRVFPGNRAIAAGLIKHVPHIEDTFFYRSFNVAMSFLGEEGMLREFVFQVRRRDSNPWMKHNKFNAKFHSFYYGSRDGALQILRTEIERGTPPNLLPLNIATLSSLSHDERDIELLEEFENKLVRSGVEPEEIKSARNQIALTIRNCKTRRRR